MSKHKAKFSTMYEINFRAGYGCDSYASGTAPHHPDMIYRQIRNATLTPSAYAFFDTECIKCESLSDIDAMLARYLTINERQTIS